MKKGEDNGEGRCARMSLDWEVHGTSDAIIKGKRRGSNES